MFFFLFFSFSRGITCSALAETRLTGGARGMLRLRERIAKEQPLSCSSPVHRPGFILLFISHFPRRRENRHQYFACKDLFKATMATQGTLTGSYSASLASVSLSDLRFVFSPFSRSTWFLSTMSPALSSPVPSSHHASLSALPKLQVTLVCASTSSWALCSCTGTTCRRLTTSLGRCRWSSMSTTVSMMTRVVSMHCKFSATSSRKPTLISPGCPSTTSSPQTSLPTPKPPN